MAYPELRLFNVTQALYGGGPALINSVGQLWNAGYIDTTPTGPELGAASGQVVGKGGAT